MNCLKAVILLWTCIIAFHAWVTAIVVKDYNISAISINSIGGLFKSVDVYFKLIRNKENQDVFDEIFKTPEATLGPEQHIIGYADKKLILDMDMPNPSKENAALNRTLLELTEKLLQFNPSQKEMSTKLIEE